jgi:hypothetical protein
MNDRCSIGRGALTQAFDETTMTYTAQAPAPVASDVPCRVQPAPQRDHIVDAASEPVTLRRYQVSVPISITDVQVDDHVTITTSRDAGLLGRSLRVLEFGAGTYQGERLLTCFDDLG